MSFGVGQRWVSQTEPKLGLGIISEFSNRRLTINFPAAGESRTYAMDNAPVSRVSYKPGDIISNHEDQSFVVVGVNDRDVLIEYQVTDESGIAQALSEIELNCFIQFTSPLQRLVSGHYDRNRAFRMRYQTLQNLNRLQQSPVRGLVGSRTNLLPHQVFIADQVSQRYSPRVLLADEVGLGKTIEAGMILHAQLHKGLANRVLIVVPSTLIHQWLIEMLRRFNLRFSIFDQERFDSLIEEGHENPFETEQLILCDQDFLVADPLVQKHALAADWDMLVVDEAHHLHWSEQGASEDYQCIEALASRSAGVLLLTATPEQAGIESHFARLRLLDPDRFHCLSTFIEQEQSYSEVSSLVSELQVATEAEAALPATLVDRAKGYVGDESGIDWASPAAEMVPSLVQQLLDQHGTGRVLFRNTRQAIEGFPERVLLPYPLSAESEVHDLKSDPRLAWLIDLLKECRPEKVLIICQSAGLALELEAHLRLREGMRTAAFYEGLTIVERDRAAAYFADKEDGAQALICSEIGSEGRNFQFAHHLVLFDLPENPDLLEQRIGRLDRIGQSFDVQIHAPYLIGSRQEGLFHWYDRGLDAFTHSCAAGFALYEQFQDQLEEFLEGGDFASAQALAFIDQVREKRDLAMAELQTGRDPLLELNSCNQTRAGELIELLETQEASQELASYMELVFNMYGVEQDFQSDSTVIIHPGEHMLMQDFPGLSEEGLTLTYHRLKALVREEVDFLSWEHPIVVEIMEQLLGSELGNAALVTMSVEGVKPGTLFLESIFSLNSMAPKQLQLERFLPISPMRVVVSLSGRDITDVLPHEKINQLCSGLKRSMAHAVVKEIRNDIETLLSHAQVVAEQRAPKRLQEARDAVSENLDLEIQRMIALKQKNSLIRQEEIDFLQTQKEQCLAYIDKTGLDVQAMRMVIIT